MLISCHSRFGPFDVALYEVSSLFIFCYSFWSSEELALRKLWYCIRKTSFPNWDLIWIMQATLGDGKSTSKSTVQCNVGNKSPVLLCSMIPNVSETCHLELEFEEDEEVIFSVLGQRSVHLTGYYLGHGPGLDGEDTYPFISKLQHWLTNDPVFFKPCFSRFSLC